MRTTAGYEDDPTSNSTNWTIAATDTGGAARDLRCPRSHHNTIDPNYRSSNSDASTIHHPDEQHWREQQADRQPLAPPRAYVAARGTALFWYDPRTGQTLEIGTLLGEFTAIATFRGRGDGQPALLVVYHINNEYGLTAISDAVVQRTYDAGYPNQVEAFILISDDIQPT